jgi:hypothetical protein
MTEAPKLVGNWKNKKYVRGYEASASLGIDSLAEAIPRTTVVVKFREDSIIESLP